jgi:LPXTG-motif cell wall-anchored protein
MRVHTAKETQMNRLLAVAVIAIGLIPLAASADNGNHFGWGQGVGNPHGGTPLPLIGAGLPGLAALVAGYFLFRRKQRKD